MAFITTPHQLRRMSEFYGQLGRMISSGIRLVKAFESMRRNFPGRSIRRNIDDMLLRLEGGATLGEAVRQQTGWLPEFDVALIEASERSGRLDVCFRELARYYSESARLVKEMISQLIYPVLVFHAAILIFPVPALVDLILKGEAAAYIGQKATLLIPAYALVLLGIWATQSRHREQWRAFLERLFRFVPFLGAARRNLALARLSLGLEALLSAGVLVVEAWQLAAAASGSPALRREVATWGPYLEGGDTPAEIMSRSSEFPELYTSQYHSGEVSGRLEETLSGLYRYHQEEGLQQMKTFAQVTSKGIYFVMVLVVAYLVVTYWVGYFQGMMDTF